MRTGCLRAADAVVHTATLHKPHISSHGREAFLYTNITGTLTLLEESVDAGVGRFVFTSTTSVFGRALTPEAGAPAAWITEDMVPVPRNIYGVTKLAAENLCELVSNDHGLPCVILRTSRFFPEGDDHDEIRTTYDALNVKVNELLYRRVDLEDVVAAHQLALARAPEIGFGCFIVSATTPFESGELLELHADAPAVVGRYCPEYETIYSERGWKMFPTIDRVYVNIRAKSVRSAATPAPRSIRRGRDLSQTRRRRLAVHEDQLADVLRLERLAAGEDFDSSTPTA